MNELDMSRPGNELFPEYNSYQDVSPVVADPTGVFSDVADQMSDKEINFRALREETAKFKEEASYWKGQAEAFSKMPRQEQEAQQDAYSALDWEDSRDVRKAFDSIRDENQRLRHEMKDALTAIETKTQRQDWNAMVTQHAPQLMKNPIFAEMIRNSSNPYEAAYLLAEMNSKSQQPQQNMYGQRAVSNAQKPASLASVGGNSQLSAADYYANMSDEEFMKIAGRNLANI